MTAIAGLDLSLRGCGMVAIPEGWDLDWPALPRLTVGHPLLANASEADRIGRLIRLRTEVLEFMAEHGPDVVWLEAPAYSRRSSSANALSELHGAVKCGLVDYGFAVRVVNASAARKTLLGFNPPKHAKVLAQQAVYSFGGKALTGDEVDAWIVANHGRGATGVPSWTLGESAA